MVLYSLQSNKTKKMSSHKNNLVELLKQQNDCISIAITKLSSTAPNDVDDNSHIDNSEANISDFVDNSTTTIQ